MKQKTILIISGNTETTGSWPDKYETVSVCGDEAAIEIVQQQDFAAIVLDDSDGTLPVKKLNALLPILQPEAALFSKSAAGNVQAAVEAHFRSERNARLRRLLVLDSSHPFTGSELPAFSAN